MYNKKDKIVIVLISILGSISQPLIAYAYMLLGNFVSIVNNIDLYKIILLVFFSFMGIGVYYFILSYLKNRITLNLKQSILKKMLYADLKDITKKDYSEHINLLNVKVDTWKDMYFMSLVFILKDSLQLLFMSMFLFFISYKVAFILLLLLIPLIINNIFFPKYIEKNLENYFYSQDILLSDLKDIFGGINVIKNCHSEDIFINKLNKRFKNTNDTNQKIDNLENVSGFLANSGVALSQILGVALSSYLLSKKSISLGEFMGMLQLTFFLNEPLISLINNALRLNSAKNINKEILVNLYNNNTTKEYIKENNCNGISEIKIKNMSFGYDGFFVLNNINFLFEKNKKYLIKGKSGSGKSTLVKLLLKLENVTEGDILIDGKSIRETSVEYINNNIGYLHQESYIFNLTLRENIDVNGTFDDEKIIEIIKKVNLDKLYDELGGLDTILDKVKREISGGEKVRISLARLLLLNKKVIITDEVLAHLDKENSEKIEGLLLSLDDKMVINICHHHNEEFSRKYDGCLLL